MARSVISAHAPHEFRTSEVKSTFGESVRAQPLHSPRLLLTNPSRRLQCPIGLSFAPPTRTLPCSDVPSKVVPCLQLPPFFPRERHGHRAMAPSIASTTLVSHKLHAAAFATHTLKDQVLLARNGVDHECVVARLHF